MGEITCGSMILKKTVKCPAPSMNAASAYAQSTLLKQLYMMIKAAFTVCAMMIT